MKKDRTRTAANRIFGTMAAAFAVVAVFMAAPVRAQAKTTAPAFEQKSYTFFLMDKTKPMKTGDYYLKDSSWNFKTKYTIKTKKHKETSLATMDGWSLSELYSTNKAVLECWGGIEHTSQPGTIKTTATLKPKKTGTTTIVARFWNPGKQKYYTSKCKVTIKKADPLKSVKVNGEEMYKGGGSNLTKYHTKASTASVKVTPAAGWKVKSMTCKYQTKADDNMNFTKPQKLKNGGSVKVKKSKKLDAIVVVELANKAGEVYYYQIRVNRDVPKVVNCTNHTWVWYWGYDTVGIYDQNGEYKGDHFVLCDVCRDCGYILNVHREEE